MLYKSTVVGSLKVDGQILEYGDTIDIDPVKFQDENHADLRHAEIHKLIVKVFEQCQIIG